MKSRLLLVVLALAPAVHLEAKDWRKLIPFGKQVDTDPNKQYQLTNQHGPWLILCASFAGETAEQQAHDLVMELRKRFQLQAYKHRRTYDFSKPVVGLGYNRDGGAKIMKHRQDSRFTEVAVLVGHFQTIDSPQITRALDRIKHLHPEALDFRVRKGSDQRFSGLRNLYRHMSPSKDIKSKGPMGKAFVTRNPLIPAEYFAPKGVDSFVLKMNKNVQYSLLKNPKPFTVRVATLRGTSSFNPQDAAKPIRRGNQPTKLELAAENAHRLTLALRKRGIEAWEFHDRYESVVCIGSFDSWGTDLPHGAIEINPAMLQIIKRYGAMETAGTNANNRSLQPRSESGVPFDMQPEPMKVPRASIAADYARNR